MALKIRDTIAERTKEFEAELNVLKDQLAQVQQEVIRRLVDRGSTQTKTPYGTAFLGEHMTGSIADEQVFEQFVLAEKDLAFFQKRLKIEHLREYMKSHDGQLPPGINVFREVTLNLRKS